MMTTIAKPYAYAINMLTETKQAQKSWLKFLNGLNDLVANADFFNLVNHPSISDQEVFDVSKKALKLKNDQHENLLKILIKNKRLNAVSALLENLESMYLHSNNQVKAVVKSASQLSPGLKQSIQSYIKNKFNVKGVELSVSLQPDLIGALMIDVDGKQIDWTISHQLKQFKEQF
jgi:F-type H+-transporting ATPase subunit delta|tara:strand:+ start:550 stop:1074 length:525 start_codon:yes stop_codon:yes gene_type:complete